MNLTLDDYKTRPYESLTPEEAHTFFLILMGWEREEDDENEGMFLWIHSKKIECLSDSCQAFLNTNPRTDRGTALELFEAKAEEYGLFLCIVRTRDGVSRFECGYEVEGMTPGGEGATADTAALAICDATYNAWQFQANREASE